MKKGLPEGGKLPDRELLFSNDITNFFMISYRTLMRWIAKEILKPIKEGGILYFKRIDIMGMLG